METALYLYTCRVNLIGPFSQVFPAAPIGPFQTEHAASAGHLEDCIVVQRRSCLAVPEVGSSVGAQEKVPELLASRTRFEPALGHA